MDLAQTLRGFIGADNPPPPDPSYDTPLRLMADPGPPPSRKPKLSFDLYPKREETKEPEGEHLHDILDEARRRAPSLESDLVSNAAETAALRTRESVRPTGGREEGLATTVIEKAPGALISEPFRAIGHGADAMRRVYEGDLDPLSPEGIGEGFQAGMQVIGQSPFMGRNTLGAGGGRLVQPSEPMAGSINWNRERAGGIPTSRSGPGGIQGGPIPDYMTVIDVPVAALDKAWAKDQRLAKPKQQVVEHAASGEPMSLAEINTGPGGDIWFGNGRNRFMAARDAGDTTIPVAVPKDKVGEVRERLQREVSPSTAKTIEDYLPGIERLSVNSILHPDTAPLKQNSRTVEEIAKDLHDRGSDALRGLGVKSGRIEGPGAHDEIVSHGIAHEVEGALQRGGRSALDWYTSKIKEAMGHAARVYPELASDPHADMAFKAALAVTSQDETVSNNVRLADRAYRHFRETGRFPTNVVAGKGKVMNSNFQKLNDMIDEHGLAGTKEFLGSKFKVKDLVDAGHNISGENVDTMVHGSAILGPKIGGGFYQNLMGNFDPVTMDKWFMRGWGRLTGTLSGTATEKGLAKQQEAMERLLKDAGEKVPRSEKAMRARADAIVNEHERNFRKYRSEYDSGARTKSDLVKAADRWLIGRHGINEQPGGGAQREWIRDRVNRARKILESRGHKMTNADLQATWWYPEKDLYGKLGGKNPKGLNVDYSSAIQDLLKQKEPSP
jgi:ElaB/YqjD/DUF883 family membrane-anchored ribosome-binding protein